MALRLRRVAPKTPSDAGGVAARKGFSYQDHVAAQLVLEMLSNPEMRWVECETSDDIVVVWHHDGQGKNEYIQVKTTEDDKKWAQTEICKRASGAHSAGQPSSLVEKSLLTDCFDATPIFRIVSRRDVQKSLSPLKVPLDASHRDHVAADRIGKSLLKIHKTKSKNERDLRYWATNTFWQVAGSAESLVAVNMQALLRCADQHGANPTHTHAQTIYDDLLRIVSSAGAASAVSAPDQKKILRSDAISWWRSHLANTEAAQQRTSKPYRAVTETFFSELHHLDEHEILRALTGYDARFELKRWRSDELADYLVNWLPEVALKASELVQVGSNNLRQKLTGAIRQIERHRTVDQHRIIGEVLLHAILRHRLQSEPIACKLFYQSGDTTKSFKSAHIVHGDGRDQLWLGRATLAKADDYDAIVQTIAEEMEHALDADFLKDEREVILTLREPQHMLPTTLEAALQSSSPIDDLIQVICIPILIGYDSEVLRTGFSDDYESRLKTEISGKYSEIKPTLPLAIEAVRVHVFLVPIECVATLAHQFMGKVRGS